MENYFLISTPLHLCLAAAIAMREPQHSRVAVVMSRNAGSATAYAKAARCCPDIFSSVAVLRTDPRDGRWARRRSLYRQVEALVAHPAQMRIFTGNDRRLEYQYAMHVASRAGAHVEGIYIDDGAATYVGQRSMARWAHRYVEPALRKLLHGWWFKNAVTQGTSAWTSTAYVAFPHIVHPLVRAKKLVAIDLAPLRSDRFQTLIEGLVPDADALRRVVADLRVIVTLPKERDYLEDPRSYRPLWEHLRAHFDAAQIGIKAHPRSTRLDAALDRMFPGASKLDTGIGMEFLLTMLPDGCIVIGDISSTVITSRWIRPDLPVIAMQPSGGMAANRKTLYDELRISVSSVDRLGTVLSGLRRPTAT